MERIDSYIENRIFKKLKISRFEDIKTNDIKFVISRIILYFEKNGYNGDELKNSKYSDNLFAYLHTNYKNNLLKDLKLIKEKKGKLIKGIIENKNKIEEEIASLITDLENNIFDAEIHRFNQQLRKIFGTSTYRFLIEPLTNKNCSSNNSINSIITPILRVKNGIDAFKIYEENIDNYNLYNKNLSDINSYDNKFFKPIFNHLFNLFKSKCNINPTLTSSISIYPTQRKYNLLSRETVNVFFELKNSGEGIAKKIILIFYSDYLQFTKNTIKIETLQKETREIRLEANINNNKPKSNKVKISIKWEEINGEIKKEFYEVKLLEQEDINIPWDEIKNNKPYSISIIENKDNLFGRDNILKILYENFTSNNLESFILYGQKRVGKSSIVKSLKTELDKLDNMIVVYKSMGNLKAIDPIQTFNNLGENICDEIIEELLIKYENTPKFYSEISNLEIPNFNGSLAPVENFIKRIRRFNRKLKFVFILDEFDELNQEFFKPGTIGETFSINIGKGLNDYRHIGFILVGSENMAFLNWQGMRFNNFREERVDTFNKSNQYLSYKKIITEPVKPYLKYNELAIEYIYDYSNGNPYFTNLICEKAFITAYKYKDLYIDEKDIENAVNLFIESEGKGRFEHFWSDGINTETTTNKDKISDIRKRILISFSIAFEKINDLPTEKEILNNIPKPQEYNISQLEFERIYKEFFNRKIFNKVNNKVEIKPKIFQEWLLKRGKDLLVEGVADLKNIIREQEIENKLYITDEEIDKFINKIKFNDIKLKKSTVRNFLNQFGKNSIQRKAFNILDNLFFISNEEVHSFFRTVKGQVFKQKIISLKEGQRKIKREDVSIYSFDKYFEENEKIINSFKLIADIDFRRKTINLKNEPYFYKKQKSSTIIIIEPIINNIEFFSSELSYFVENVAKDKNLEIILVSLLATDKAKSKLNKLLRSFSDINIKYFNYKTVDEVEIFPYYTNSQILGDSNETNNNYSALKTIFYELTKEAIIVLFESYCPCRSISFLWKKTDNFTPLFLNPYNCNKPETSKREQLRKRAFEANTKLSQEINKHIVSFLKDKTNSDDWLIESYVPKDVIQKVYGRWIEEGKKYPLESYLDFIDYKKIINKNSKELIKIYSIKRENLKWLDRLNILRRDPAHPEKPAPKEEDVVYFEKITKLIISKLKAHNNV